MKQNLIELAASSMLGEEVPKLASNEFELDYVGIKASQFSFSRLQNADPVLGVEMASTGEVGCIGDDYHEAVLKAALSVGMRIPENANGQKEAGKGKGVLISSGPLRSKLDLLDSAKRLNEKGYLLYATEGTYDFFTKNGVPVIRAYRPSEVERVPNLAMLGAIELIREKKIDLVINIPKNLSETELHDGYWVRRCAVDHNVTLFTNARLAVAFIDAFCKFELNSLPIKSWNEYKI